MKELDEWTIEDWKRVGKRIKQATKDLKEDNDEYDKKVKEEKE